MKNKVFFIWFLAFFGLSSCERGANLSPKISKFNPSIHLKKINGKEKLPKEIATYLKREQSAKRTLASSSNLDAAYSPENAPKFPLSYFLIPIEMAQFLQAETRDQAIINQMSLKISGKEHVKFFIHPANEDEFSFLRGIYNYIGSDRTEFLASPSTDPYTPLVWNQNNTKSKPFIAKIYLDKSDLGIRINKQIILNVPKNAIHEKN